MQQLYIARIILVINTLAVLKTQSKDLICQIIQSNRYICETHLVHTLDGYHLTLHRIPPKYPQENSTRNRSHPFVLFHGLMGSAADFILPGRMKALACLLHEQGFDVWLPNARGTTYSKQHEHMNSSMDEFWNFSWHEIGYYDLPAIIEYVLKITDRKKLHYIAHSQGSTAFFVLLSERPEYNRFFATVNLLAPVAYMSNLQSPALRLMALKSDKIEALLNHLGLHELFPSTALNQLGGHLLCGKDMPTQDLCLLATYFLLGFSDYQIDRTLFPRIFESTPAGISRRQLQHFGQLINSGEFQQFDYELRNENYRHYKRKTPPKYKLQNVRISLQLFYGNRDLLATKKDVLRLTEALRYASYELHEINGFNHIDFLYSSAALQLIYRKIIELVHKNRKCSPNIYRIPSN